MTYDFLRYINSLTYLLTHSPGKFTTQHADIIRMVTTCPVNLGCQEFNKPKSWKMSVMYLEKNSNFYTYLLTYLPVAIICRGVKRLSQRGLDTYWCLQVVTHWY